MTFDQKTIRDYLTITSGVFGRLAISVVYFLIVANVLTLAEFGVFAAISALGLVMSRLLAFGFISPVYRVATVKHRLLGVYTGGLLIFALFSLPIIGLLAFGLHAVFFKAQIALSLFLLILVAEILCWRVVEYVVIMLNGLSRFGKAASLVIAGSAMRTLAAVAFFLSSSRGLDVWIGFYVAANVATLLIALLVFAPPMRLRLVWKLYPRKLRDAVTAALSELTFYVQSELDKLLVLTMAGDRTAGIYAIVMRLIDLTAIPVRSFNQMLVQKLMRGTQKAVSAKRQITMELAIAVVSTLGLVGFIVLLWFFPTAMGGNVARAAPFLLPMLAIPALRNLVEYQGELLYARELVVTRLLLLATLAVLKLALMVLLIQRYGQIEAWALPLSAVFFVLYIVSTLVTYRQLSR
ncbi:MAG: lipopolysaccharide biosynthesis protein [Beijerinckiaceae bacterium]